MKKLIFQFKKNWMWGYDLMPSVLWIHLGRIDISIHIWR